jgi:hypothetical protein
VPKRNRAITDDTDSYATARVSRARLDPRRTRIGAAVAVAFAVGFALWLVFRGDSSPSKSPVPTGANPVRISLKGLKTLAGIGIPIYWVGKRPGVSYELTKTADNRIFIRYLPAGVPIGSSKPYLTIGTYPVSDAFTVTSRLARSSGSNPVDIGRGAVAFVRGSSPESVFLAYRGSDVQIEIYDPTPGRARDLVTSRRVTAVR